MGSTRSNKPPQFRLTVLAALLGVAGCSTLSSTPDQSTSDPAAATSAAIQAGNRDSSNKSASQTADSAKTDANGDQLVESRQYDNLWDRIKAGYAMPELDTHLVGIHERWYANNPEYMAAMVQRARLYLFYIVEEVEKRGMPMESPMPIHARAPWAFGNSFLRLDGFSASTPIGGMTAVVT